MSSGCFEVQDVHRAVSLVQDFTPKVVCRENISKVRDKYCVQHFCATMYYLRRETI